MANFLVNQGTSTELFAGSLTNGTIVGIMRLDIGTGASASPWGGTTTVGTVPGAGTITNVGSLTNFGTGKELSNLVTGTLASLGTLPGLGTITNLGSVTNFGTGKELSNLVTGTLASLGTLPGIGTITNLGSITNFGTGKEVSNLVGGTITALATGTITGGTLGNLNYGTVNIDPTPIKITPLAFGTLGTAGGSFFGTLSGASGAGTKHYITGLSVIGQAGTADVRVLAGSSIQGTGVLGAGNVVPAGGYVRDFVVPFATGTNSEILYHFVGAGSAFIVVSYWKGA